MQAAARLDGIYERNEAAEQMALACQERIEARRATTKNGDTGEQIQTETSPILGNDPLDAARLFLDQTRRKDSNNVG